MSRFLNEIKNFRPVYLGDREEELLSILFYKDFAAYEIFKMLRDDLKESTGYKHVHHRVKRLESLGLIEQSDKKGTRNKIFYRLKSRGLFEVLLNGNYFPIPSVLNRNRNNVILERILYKFFDPNTIRKFVTFPRIVIMTNYLRKCCDSIRIILVHQSKIDIEDLDLIIEKAIEDEIKDFVLQIVSSRIRENDYRFYPGRDMVENRKFENDDMEDENGPNYIDLFPRPALKRDKKFMKILKEIKLDFDEGCKYYLET